MANQEKKKAKKPVKASKEGGKVIPLRSRAGQSWRPADFEPGELEAATRDDKHLRDNQGSDATGGQTGRPEDRTKIGAEATQVPGGNRNAGPVKKAR